VFASKRDEKLAGVEQTAGHAPDAGHRGFEIESRQVHLGQRQHAMRMDVHAQFLVPQLDLRRREQ
jgi:hypothetical protein